MSLLFFADHCVSESVCKLLEERGHVVDRLRHSIPTDSPDAIVARFAEHSEAILLSSDRDFERIAPPNSHWCARAVSKT